MEEVRGENKGDNGGVDMLWLVVLVMSDRRSSVMNGQQKRSQGQGEHFGPLGIFATKGGKCFDR
jgi:hypothetical protein